MILRAEASTESMMSAANQGVAFVVGQHYICNMHMQLNQGLPAEVIF